MGLKAKWGRTERDKYAMTSLSGGIYIMTQMNMSIEEKQTHRHREQTCGYGGAGERRTGSLGEQTQTSNMQDGQLQGPTV